MLETQLIKLGLNKNEAKVYLAVLSLGLTLAGPIVKQTKLHRTIVYNALERLEDLRLISVLHKNNRQHFQTTNPENLLTPIQEREEIANDIIPQLLSLQNHTNEKMDIRILYGSEGFWSNLKDIINSASQDDKVMRIIGGAPASEFYKAIGSNYSAYKRILKKTKVSKWLLSPKATSQDFKDKFDKEASQNKLKTLPEGLSSPTYTRITHEMVSIEIYSNPLIIIQIKNKPIAESYLEHFNLLWRMAK